MMNVRKAKKILKETGYTDISWCHRRKVFRCTKNGQVYLMLLTDRKRMI